MNEFEGWDALDWRNEVMRLRAEIDRRREANRWRPISEPPPDSRDVLVVEWGSIRTGWMGDDGVWTVDCVTDEVTHWRPLPELPGGTA